MSEQQLPQGFDREDCRQYIWDVFKTINGIRPRFMNLGEMSDLELHTTAESLQVELQQHLQEEQQIEQVAIVKFEELLASTAASGAGDRGTALRWLRDAHDDEQAKFDDSYFEYLYGLPYGYLKKEPVQAPQRARIACSDSSPSP